MNQKGLGMTSNLIAMAMLSITILAALSYFTDLESSNQKLEAQADLNLIAQAVEAAIKDNASTKRIENDGLVYIPGRGNSHYLLDARGFSMNTGHYFDLPRRAPNTKAIEWNASKDEIYQFKAAYDKIVRLPENLKANNYSNIINSITFLAALANSKQRPGLLCQKLSDASCTGANVSDLFAAQGGVPSLTEADFEILLALQFKSLNGVITQLPIFARPADIYSINYKITVQLPADSELRTAPRIRQGSLSYSRDDARPVVLMQPKSPCAEDLNGFTLCFENEDKVQLEWFVKTFNEKESCTSELQNYFSPYGRADPYAGTCQKDIDRFEAYKKGGCFETDPGSILWCRAGERTWFLQDLDQGWMPCHMAKVYDWHGQGIDGARIEFEQQASTTSTQGVLRIVGIPTDIKREMLIDVRALDSQASELGKSWCAISDSCSKDHATGLIVLPKGQIECEN